MVALVMIKFNDVNSTCNSGGNLGILNGKVYVDNNSSNLGIVSPNARGQDQRDAAAFKLASFTLDDMVRQNSMLPASQWLRFGLALGTMFGISALQSRPARIRRW